MQIIHGLHRQKHEEVGLCRFLGIHQPEVQFAAALDDFLEQLIDCVLIAVGEARDRHAHFTANPPAARFLRRVRKEVRSTVARFTDSYQYTIEQLLEKIIERSREQNLRLIESEEATKIDFMVFLTVQTMNYLHSGRHRVAL